MKRCILVFFLAAAMLTLSLTASAAETGSLEIKLDAGELPVTRGTVTMYQVGIPTEDGYRLLDRYGGGVIRREDAQSPSLARWLRELAGSGRELLLDVDGRAVFSGMEEGLYLVEQTQRMDGFYPFQPFLVSMPEAGDRVLRVEPPVYPIMVEESPRTGDLSIYAAVVSMTLSGTGLVVCGFWNRKKVNPK